MRPRIGHRLAGGLIAGVTLVAILLTACSPSSTDASAPPTTSGGVDASIAVLNAEPPVIEATFGGGMLNYPTRTVRIWSDAQYAVTFGSVSFSFGRSSDTALAEVVISGHVNAADIEAFVAVLNATDIDDFADRLADTECPPISDAGSSLYTLTSPTVTRDMRPCAAWTLDEYPAPLDLAAGLASAALDDQSELVMTYLTYGTGLSAFRHEDWTERSLVVGTIARIDLTEPRLAFDVDEVLVGTTEPRRYAVVGAEFERVRADERALLESAAPGDRVAALVGPDTEVHRVGFLYDSGVLMVTEISNSVLNLGHLGFVASTDELYREIGVACELSEFYRPEPAEPLAPLDSLVEIARRDEAETLRTSSLKSALAALRAEPGTISFTLADIRNGDIVIVTTGDGKYVTHARPADRTADRDTRTVTGRVPSGALQLNVWIAPDEVTTSCNKIEFGPLASSIGELLIAISVDAEPGGPSVETLRIAVDTLTGDYSVEP